MMASFLKWIDRVLKKPTLYGRLTRAMVSEGADCYHAHFPAALMLLAYGVARISGGKFTAEYNDIIVLHRGGDDRKEKYYEQQKLWGKAMVEKETQGTERAIRLIPKHTESILDVGCGDGRVANRLAGNYLRIVAIDISREALRYVSVNKVRASADYLPFPNSSFDLVLSTELLEHLPGGIYREALAEMKRVSKGWILIGIPWKEQLGLSQVRCIRCSTTFHVNYYFRRFNYSKIKDLFKPEYELVEFQLVGGERPYYIPWLLCVRRYLGGVWTRTDTTVYPKCGRFLYPGGYPERNAITKFCDERNERGKRRRAAEKSHAVALYQKLGI